MDNGIQEVLDHGRQALAHYARRRTGWPRCSACICGACCTARAGPMNALVYEWRSLSASSQHGVKAGAIFMKRCGRDVTAVDAACWPVMRA